MKGQFKISSATYRACPICGELLNTEILHEINCGYTVPYLPRKYQVALCKSCGMTYADTSASEEDYNRYYCEHNFYGNGIQIQTGESYYQRVFDGTILNMIQQETDSSASILDIGCGNGRTLSFLQGLGYRNLTGMDPSGQSIAHIQALGINGIQKSIYDEVSRAEHGTYDFAILQSVLEHFLHPRRAISNVLKYLKTNGKLLIVVPSFDDVEGFQSEETVNFNAEHINYFTAVSIRRLLSDFQMALLLQQTELHILGETLFAIFQKGKDNFDNFEENVMLRKKKFAKYFLETEQRDKRLYSKINRLGDKDTKYIIWGAGARTQHIFATTELQNINICAVVDNNPDKWGNQIGKYTVSAPDAIPVDKSKLVFIILVNYSWVAEEISAQIKCLRPEAEIIVM